MGKIRNPFFFLPLAGFVTCLFLAGAVPARGEDPEPRQPAWVEPDVDRPGSNFKILWLRGGLEACQEACAQNPLCKSYTYVREGIAERIEGCWLKDTVTPPVTDGCCVSGVKTRETVSRFLREPVVFPRETEASPTLPMEQEVIPESSGEEPEIREEKIPETGAGERRVAGLNFAATPPERVTEGERIGIPAAISLPAASIGSGRRETEGMDFAAVPPETSAVRIPEPVKAEIPETGTGRRDVRGVTYAAAPSSGRKSLSEGRGTRSVRRNIKGVDITAVPPQR
jgi:hypothetical protein